MHRVMASCSYDGRKRRFSRSGAVPDAMCSNSWSSAAILPASPSPGLLASPARNTPDIPAKIPTPRIPPFPRSCCCFRLPAPFASPRSNSNFPPFLRLAFPPKRVVGFPPLSGENCGSGLFLFPVHIEGVSSLSAEDGDLAKRPYEKEGKNGLEIRGDCEPLGCRHTRLKKRGKGNWREKRMAAKGTAVKSSLQRARRRCAARRRDSRGEGLHRGWLAGGGWERSQRERRETPLL